MTINPTSPNGPHRPLESAELDRSRARAAEVPLSTPPAAGAADSSTTDREDSVQVSSEARALAQASEVRPPKSSLPPERLQQIGERLATGFYDRPEVIDDLAKRLVSHPDFQRAQ